MPVFVTSALAFIIFQYSALNVLPFPMQEAKATKHKIATSANRGNIIPSSSPPPPQSNTASPGGCITYNPSTRTITVSCSTPARLTDIDNKLHDVSILAKQSPSGVWFLNANLVIAKGATFHIDSTAPSG
jgi:hypothetical protein